jgi:hypothetical protein
VVWIAIENAKVCVLGRVVLQKRMISSINLDGFLNCATYVLLLLIHVTDLEPNIFFAQRAGWILDDVLEALRTVSIRIVLGDTTVCGLTSKLEVNFCCCLYIMPSRK